MWEVFNIIVWGWRNRTKVRVMNKGHFVRNRMKNELTKEFSFILTFSFELQILIYSNDHAAKHETNSSEMSCSFNIGVFQIALTVLKTSWQIVLILVIKLFISGKIWRKKSATLTDRQGSVLFSAALNANLHIENFCLCCEVLCEV